eukprot:COSAG02_NODE_8806_length_2437_cov_2.487169_1_plen_316_part_10
MVAESGVAVLLAQHLRWLKVARNTVGNRLWRGVILPVVAIVFVLMMAVHVYRQQVKAERLQVPIEQIWSVASFGVIWTALPMAILIRKLYTYDTDSTDLLPVLADHQVHRGKLFLDSQRAYARASGMMPFCIWLPYMANELQVFLGSLPQHPGASLRASLIFGNGPAKVSVDGVRSLNVVCVTLNILFSSAVFYSLVAFPAPQVWSPFMYCGMIWCVIGVLQTLWATGALVWALAEPSKEAVLRQTIARASTVRVADTVSTGEIISCGRLLGNVFEFVTSWQGQTLLSTCNHFVAIALFSYGINQDQEFGLTDDLN